ncbi:glycosyltransferase [Mastigocoleus sp. MO_188.B34]|uniref:glycosyltransferase n=1 Tax=Mastigocoleus sp. MO_188.B34 TaxID=3036635 RepID=UPI00260D41F2|nr:glycosyltransferase [Mastigocoleus sp. MO_188.B34]MDJ0696298.1 glycosyltransferase [Mastigocoleus sp. MO_188.B34]
MKILHIIPSIAQIRGGPSRGVLDMVKALQQSDIEVEIATTNDNGSELLNVPLNKRIRYKNIPVYFFPRFSPSIVNLREFAFSSELTQWLWQNIQDYDLLHIHGVFSYPSTVAMAISRIKAIPYITTPHGLLLQWALQQSTQKKQIYLKLIEQTNLYQSKAVHFTSEKEQQEALASSFLELPPSNFVLPLGISVPETIHNARQRLRQYFNIPVDEPIILFLSRLHPVKGLEYLIPALGKLAQHRFSFILAGSGMPKYEDQIKSLLVSNGLNNRTYITGFVSGEFKNLLIQGANLFAQTSHIESFGLSVLEALAVGLPALVTPGVALASVVEQHKLGYVTSLDVSAIASTIENHLTNPQQAKEMGTRARQLIFEQYTWDSIAKKLIQVYTAIIKNQPIPTFN